MDEEIGMQLHWNAGPRYQEIMDKYAKMNACNAHARLAMAENKSNRQNCTLIYSGQREKQESEQFEKPPMAITNSRWHWRTTGWEKKEKKLQEEKSVKNISSSIIRKMPQKTHRKQSENLWFFYIAECEKISSQ